MAATFAVSIEFVTTTRRQFLTAAAASPLARGAAGKRPNILVIFTDQLRADMLSCTGNPYVKTPNMDRLANSGIRFERAYVTNPVCSPSRMSMLTGRMPSAIGMECNEDGARVTVTRSMLNDSLGQTFRRAGYRTVYGGKVHLPHIEGGSRPQGDIGAFGFEQLTANERGELARTASQFLKEKHDQPFLAVASFINPHDICYMAINAFARSRQSDAAARQKAVPPESPAAYLAKALRLPDGVSEDQFFRQYCPPLPANHDVPKQELSTLAIDKREFQLWVRKNWTDRDWRLHRWAYARLTEQVDREIGVVLDALRASGRDQDTLVLLTADHGDQDASHRLEHKEVLYEEATRVPFIVSGAGVTNTGAVDNGHLVSTGLDLIPTLCDFAGVAKPASLKGSSVRPFAERKSAPEWRDSLVVENHIGRAVHWENWKYMVGREAKHSGACPICSQRIQHWENPVREVLIDRDKDLGEMINLAGERSRAKQLAQGRQLLREWHDRNGVALDPGFLVE